MSAMLSHALAWAARGFRVFPCVPRTKVPKEDAFYDIATTDPEAIKRMWWNPVVNAYGDYNVGVSTDDLIVTDVDIKDGRDGTQGFVELGGNPNTLAVRTPSGGIHYYYIGDPARNRVNIATGVDIRSHHGYVLAPGSHFVDAKKGVDGYYTLMTDAPPALVPDGIAAKLTAPRETMARAGVNITYDDPAAITEAEDYLKYTALPSIEGMGGNINGFNVAARVVNDLAILPDTAAILMLEHWNERCSPPWELEDLQRFCANASQYATGTQGAKRADVVFGQVTVLPSRFDATPRERGLFLGNLPEPHLIPARPWVYNKLALRRDVTTIVAEGAGGKSTLAILIAAHASQGLPFGPYTLANQRCHKVFVHDDENDADEQARILLGICAEYKFDYKTVLGNLMFWTKSDDKLLLAHAEGSRVIRNDVNIATLTNAIREGGIDLFMLNPLVNLHQCNENDNTQMKAVMNIITGIAQETEAAGFVFHHSGKGSSSAGKQSAGNSDLARGAGAIVNASRIALTLTTATQSDKEDIGIRDEAQYTRVDNAKANVFAKGNAERAMAWFRWSGVHLGNGDTVGVPAIYDITHAVDNMDQDLIIKLDAILTGDKNAGRMTLAEALKMLKSDDLFGKLSDQANRSRIDRLANSGRMHALNDGRKAKLVKDRDDGGTTYISLA